MKLVKEHINFERSNDPLVTLQVGKKVQIENWIKNINNLIINKHSDKNRICDYTINNDLTIDAVTVDLSGTNLKELPNYINFKNVELFALLSTFEILRGCPEKVSERFYPGSFSKEEILKICNVSKHKIY